MITEDGKLTKNANPFPYKMKLFSINCFKEVLRQTLFRKDTKILPFARVVLTTWRSSVANSVAYSIPILAESRDAKGAVSLC